MYLKFLLDSFSFVFFESTISDIGAILNHMKFVDAVSVLSTPGWIILSVFLIVKSRSTMRKLVLVLAIPILLTDGVVDLYVANLQLNDLGQYSVIASLTVIFFSSIKILTVTILTYYLFMAARKALAVTQKLRR